MLAVESINLFYGAAQALRGVSVSATAGRVTCVLGRNGVGKSSLLNRLAGTDRVVVDSVAGTTVDPVDEDIELGGVTWTFVDTAGIRKRAKEASGHEFFATLRTQSALDKAEVAVRFRERGTKHLALAWAPLKKL